MSGQTIGGVIGGIIGFVVSGYNPAGFQVGFMIGSGIGSIVDPQQIQGRQWNNQTLQGSQDGLARAVVFGTGTVVGNLLDSEPKPRKGTRKESAGKGGPEINHDTAKLTYAIEICDSSELRGTKVNGVIAVWEDERLVYDVRPGTQLSAADSAKWIKNKRFFYGEETQVPPPELEAIHGVGNVPAYRGTCGMVVWDEDLMVDIKDNPRGRMPTYRFLVSVCPVVDGGGGGESWYLVAGGSSTIGGPIYAVANAATPTAWTGIPLASGADAEGNPQPAYYGGVYSVVAGGGAVYSPDRATWSSASIPSGYGTSVSHAGGPAGFVAIFGTTTKTMLRAGTVPTAYAIHSPAWGAPNGKVKFTGGHYVNFGGAFGQPRGHVIWSTDAFSTYTEGHRDSWAGMDFIEINDVEFFDGKWYASGAWYEGDTEKTGVRRAEGVGQRFSEIVLSFPAIGIVHSPYHLAATSAILGVLCTDGYVYSSADGFTTPVYSGVSNTWGARGSKFAAAGPGFVVVGSGGTAAASPDLVAWSAPSSTGLNNVESIVGTGNGQTYTGTELPDSPGYYVDGDGNVIGPSIGEGQMCGAPLDVVVRKLHDLGAPQLVDADVDFTALENDTVRGYVVQDASLTVADACDPLRPVFTFDLPSYDLKIRAIKRGGPIAWTVDPDDLVAGENTSDSSTRGQGVEYPKKLHVGYIDPALDYKLTTQISERYSTSINVVGEDRLDTLLTLSADEGAQAAHKLHKILWTELEDTRGFTLPLEYLKAAPADLFSYRGKRYRVEQMRIEGMRIVLENAAYDRASAYVSNATGVQGQAPPSPDSSLRGPTVSAAMNLPVINDSYDRAGFWWAASGLLGGWSGALLQVSRDGVTFTDGPSVTASATMGVLTDALPAASRYGQDATNALKVKLTPTSGALDTLAYEALIAGDNAAAILYPDGTAEIIQWQTATETAPREYTLTGLLRGRQDTAIALHAEGAQFVVLDDAIRFVSVEPTDLGQTLTLRPASLGTDPTANATQTLTLTTIESLREWQPYNVTVTPSYADPAGAGYCVEWIGRGRLGSSRSPVHSQWFDGYEVTFTANGQTYQARTSEQALCVGYAELSGALGAFGWPTVTVRALSKLVNYEDDFGSPPAPPVTPPPPAITPTGTPASTTLGPNGGYADDAPHPVPQPTVYSTDLIPDGTLAGWKDGSGAPLSSWWKIEGGGMVYEGPGYSTAFYEPARLRMSQYPMPRWEITVTADVQTDLGQTAALGVAWGATANLPYSDTSTAQEYPVETTVTHTYIRAQERTGLQSLNGEFIPQIAPLLVVNGSSPARASFRNVTMTVEEVPAAVTTATIANLDFASGLTGWTQWPPPGAGTPTITTVTGGVKATGVSAEGLFTFLINDDPITLVDEIGKALRMRGEFWSNDPTVYSGHTVRGASLQIAVKPTGGDYIVLPWQSSSLYRGDWTLREIWQIAEVANAGGVTIHLAIRMQQAVGYGSGVRNITVAVTDDPV